MIKNLVLCFMMMFLSCHCFGDGKSRMDEVLDRKLKTFPPNSEIIKVLSYNWFIYKWDGKYFKAYICGHKYSSTQITDYRGEK